MFNFVICCVLNLAAGAASSDAAAGAASSDAAGDAASSDAAGDAAGFFLKKLRGIYEVICETQHLSRLISVGLKEGARMV